MEEIIEINQADLYPEIHKSLPHSQLEEVYLPPLVDFQIDNAGKATEATRSIVKMGIPVNSENKFTATSLPYHPSVMFVDHLFLKDKKHQSWVYLPNVETIASHGFWDSQDEMWKFQDGQVVDDVVRSWNKYADLNKLPRCEFAMACNTQDLIDYKNPGLISQLREKIDPKHKEKLVKQLRNKIVTTNINNSGVVVESFGGRVMGSGKVEKGAVTLAFETPSTELSRLDELVSIRNTLQKIHIK